MDAKSIIEALDAEIEALRQARAVLLNRDNAPSTGKKAGESSRTVKRVLSPEARKRIADAQRKRWAAARKPKKATPVAPSAKAAKKKARTKKSAVATKKAAPKKASPVKARSAPKKPAPVKTEPPKAESSTA